MEIGSHLVGSGLKEYRKEVSWREIMNYAAAVGDNNPCYFDDERMDGIIAHPMFCVAVTWPVTEKLEEFIESRASSCRDFRHKGSLYRAYRISPPG